MQYISFKHVVQHLKNWSQSTITDHALLRSDLSSAAEFLERFAEVQLGATPTRKTWIFKGDVRICKQEDENSFSILFDGFVHATCLGDNPYSAICHLRTIVQAWVGWQGTHPVVIDFNDYSILEAPDVN